MVLLLLSLVAGALTVLAPCVLPLLPVIIGGSLAGGKQSKSRPYLVAGSLVVSLLVFTLLLKASTALIGVSPKVWIYLSGGIVIALGLTSLFPAAWDVVINKWGWQAASQRLLGKGTQRKDWLGPILTGAALGPVFSSCSPTYAFLLATVLPRNLAAGLAYLVVYCIGLVLVLLLICVYGQRFITRFTWAADPRGAFRRGLGILFIIVGVSIVFGWDKQAETWLTEHSPIDITSVDQKLFDTNQSNTKTKNGVDVDTSDTTLFNVNPVPAPELVGLQSWINSNPLTLKQLKGKVVLVDFWTYSCINCVRTLPYVEHWYETYKDQGFVVIGVHAPEFAFEHVESNVRDAVKQRHITYPVALDNDLATWNAFSNQYWPAHYLIDKEGIIRNAHFGEGDYDITEEAIQKLLGANGPVMPVTDVQQGHSDITPETYFGLQRAGNYVGTPNLQLGQKTYQPQQNLEVNQWTLGGSWREDNDKLQGVGPDSELTFHVQAKDVYVVASESTGQPYRVQVSADNQPEDWSGADDPNGLLTVQGSNLYHIASFKNYQDATLHLKVPAGVSLHTFTFGS